MKKKLFFFLLLLTVFFTNQVSAQGIYNIQYDAYEWGPGSNVGGCEIYFNIQGMPNVTGDTVSWGDFYEDLGSNRKRETFPANAVTLNFIQRWYWGGDGQQRYNYTNDIKDAYHTSCFYTKQYALRPKNSQNSNLGSPYFGWYSRDGDWFRVSIWPMNLAINTVISAKADLEWILLENEITTLKATAGFPSDAYNWKYKVGDLAAPGGWIDFPGTYNGQSTISFTGKDLLLNSANFASRVGGGIHVAIWAKDSVGQPKQYGDVVTLKPKFNAPKIVSVTPQLAKCSGSSVSSLKIKLDKPLGNGNHIKLLNLPVGVGSGTPVEYTSSNFDPVNNTYEWTNLPTNAPYHISVNDYLDNNDHSFKATYYISPNNFIYTLNLFPPVLQTNITKNGIFCNGGQDASIGGRVKGGTPPYNLIYSNKTSGVVLASKPLVNSDPTDYVIDALAVQNLPLGTYKLAVADKNGCPSQSEITVVQPATAITAVSRTVTDAKGYGLSDGKFEIKLKGGTFTNPNGYNLPTLKKGTTTYTAQLTNSASSEFTFTFYNLPAGTYNFRAEDLNKSTYGFIKDSLGCLVKETLTIIQPAPLTLAIEQTQPIVCHAASTAALTGHALGGKRFASGKPYVYTWMYSSTGIASSYVIVPGTDSILNGRIAGYYKLEVKDQNDNKVTQILQVTQPAAITYTVTVDNVTCLNWTDGALSVSDINGGTAPYVITWPDGSHGSQISNLAFGPYEVKVSDAFACEVSKDTIVKDTLNGITVEQGSYKPPHCYYDADGSMGIKVTVESLPYTVLWNTGSTDTLLSNIKAGTYTVQVRNNNNCLKEATFNLSEPKQIPLELETDRYLCEGQTADYDIEVPDSLYQYQWLGTELNTTETQVSLTLPGTYTASISDLRGCSRTESITVHRVNATVSSDFVISSQVFAGEEVFLVNITQDQYTDSCAWDFGNNSNIEVVESSYEYATLIFKEKGSYKIGLKSRLGECVKVEQKEIMVLESTYEHKPYSGATSFIKDFEIRPNPNDGNFEVKISLEDIASVKLTLLDFYSKSDIKDEFQFYDQKEYLLPIHTTVAPGTYILFLETQYGTRIAKVMIMQ